MTPQERARYLEVKAKLEAEEPEYCQQRYAYLEAIVAKAGKGIANPDAPRQMWDAAADCLSLSHVTMRNGRP